MAPTDQKKSKKRAVAEMRVNSKDNPGTSRATPVDDEANRRQTQSTYGLRVIRQPNANEGILK